LSTQKDESANNSVFALFADFSKSVKLPPTLVKEKRASPDKVDLNLSAYDIGEEMIGN